MNFEEFRIDLESKINTLIEFEMQEFRFSAYSFGSGLAAYRINGLIHKFVYDGRDKELTWFVSKPFQKYSEASYSEILRKSDLSLSLNELKKEIKTVHNNG